MFRGSYLHRWRRFALGVVMVTNVVAGCTAPIGLDESEELEAEVPFESIAANEIEPLAHLEIDGAEVDFYQEEDGVISVASMSPADQPSDVLFYLALDASPLELFEALSDDEPAAALVANHEELFRTGKIAQNEPRALRALPHGAQLDSPLSQLASHVPGHFGTHTDNDSIRGVYQSDCARQSDGALFDSFADAIGANFKWFRRTDDPGIVNGWIPFTERFFVHVCRPANSNVSRRLPMAGVYRFPEALNRRWLPGMPRGIRPGTRFFYYAWNLQSPNFQAPGYTFRVDRDIYAYFGEREPGVAYWISAGWAGVREYWPPANP